MSEVKYPEVADCHWSNTQIHSQGVTLPTAPWTVAQPEAKSQSHGLQLHFRCASWFHKLPREHIIRTYYTSWSRGHLYNLKANRQRLKISLVSVLLLFHDLSILRLWFVTLVQTCTLFLILWKWNHLYEHLKCITIQCNYTAFLKIFQKNKSHHYTHH